MIHSSISTKERASFLWLHLHSWLASRCDDQKPKGTLAALDGVRACAFLIIFCYHMSRAFTHTGLWSAGHLRLLDALTDTGETGVTLFFVLSGFLLFIPYANALLFNKSWPGVKIFYIRRVLRIFPGYFFALFLLVVLKDPYLLAPRYWGKLLPFLTFTMDFSNSQPVDGPLWTLAVECQYYLLLPWLAFTIFGLTQLARPEKRLWIILGCLFAIIGWGVALTFVASPPVALPVSPTSLGVLFAAVYGERGKFPEDFAVGMSIAVMYVFLTNAPESDRYLRRMQRLSPIVGIGAVVCFVYTALRFYSLVDNYLWPLLPGLFRLLPWHFDQEIDMALCYGGLIVAVLFHRPDGWFKRVFEWKPLRWLGMLSFSLYIWHDVFINAIQQNVIPSLASVNHYVAMALAWLVAICMIFPFCFLVYMVIEKPGMHFSEQVRQHMLAKMQSQAPEISFPSSRFSEMPASEQTPMHRANTQSESSSPRMSSREWLPGNLNLDQDVRRQGSVLPTKTARLARNKHRLQPFPTRETSMLEE